MSSFAISYVALWVLASVSLVGVLLCLRQMGEIYLVSAGLKGIGDDGIRQGDQVPDFQARVADEEFSSLRELIPTGGVLIFAAENCTTCKQLLPELIARPSVVPIVVIYDGTPPLIPIDSPTLRIVQMTDDRLPVKYKVRVTPFAFAITKDFRVRSKGLVNSVEQIAYHAAQLPET